MSLNNSHSLPKRIEPFDGMIVLVILYLVFKPMELMSFNYYLPVYLISIPAGVWFVRNFLQNQQPTIAWSILIALALMTLIGVSDLVLTLKTSTTQIFTWPAWFCVMALGAYLATKSRDVSSFMPGLFKVLVLSQTVIASLQLFFPDAFNVFWSSEKTAGFEGYVRVTGSFYNPNFFAVAVAFMTVAIISRDGIKKNFGWILLGYSLILFSGSRTLIIGMPILLGTWFYVIAGQASFKVIMRGALLSVGMLFFAYIVLSVLGSELRYANQLVSAIEGVNPSLSNVNSYAYRQFLWHEALVEFFSRDYKGFFIGTSDKPIINNPHQNFIYVLRAFGVIGFTIHILLVGISLSLAYSLRDKYEGRLLYLSTLLMIGYGMLDNSLGKMTLGIFFAFVLGIVLRHHLAISGSSLKKALKEGA